MGSQGGADDGNGVFNTTDPFHAHEQEHDATVHRELTRYDTAEDAGVRSSDPFASDRAQSNADNEPVQQYATAEAAGYRSSNPFGSTEEENNQQEDNGPPSAISPGAERKDNPLDEVAGKEHGEHLSTSSSSNYHDTSEVFDHATSTGGNMGTAAVDHAQSLSNNQNESDAPQDDDLEHVNSNVNGDRAERGTALFSNAEPFPPKEDESSGDSGKSSSDDADNKQDEKKTIAFAADDKFDEAPTREDSSPDLMEIVKSTVTDLKDKFHLKDMKSTGPIKGFNPTSVRMRVAWGSDPNAERDPNNELSILWRSRDNRKGRNSVVMPRASMAYPNLPQKGRPIFTASFKGVRRNLYRMACSFPYWDMAFWSGWSYTWGSVLFVMDGTWAWLPYSYPEIPMKWGEDYAVGIVFFIGALLYQLGATMAYLEAVNDGSFHGSAMRRFLEGHEDEQKRMLDEKIHGVFHHLSPRKNKQEEEEEKYEERVGSIDPDHGWKTIHRPEQRRGSMYPPNKSPAPRRGGVDLGEVEEGESHEYLTWRWYPSWHALSTHHIYEIGYIACSIQLFGATLYSWCGLVSLPPISDKLTTNTLEYGAYWFPEICGSCCFITASVMFLLETQEKWYKPMPLVMGWWIGLWAFIGSAGFLLNGVFGVIAQDTDAHWASYQSELSSTWGSFGYLCSALCQWYEAVNKHPVEELFEEPGQMKSYQVHVP